MAEGRFSVLAILAAAAVGDTILFTALGASGVFDVPIVSIILILVGLASGVLGFVLGAVAMQRIGRSDLPMRGRSLARACAVLSVAGAVAAGAVLADFFSETEAEINADKALVALTKIVDAQRQFNAGHERYAKSLAELADAGLIDKSIAAALPGKTDYMGYYYAMIFTADGEPIKPESGFAVCAFPRRFGEQARKTFIVNEAGDIFWIVNGGRPANDFPDEPEDAGWEFDMPLDPDVPEDAGAED